MRIKEISIQNFRSYYGTSVFKINERLTLIVGSNGDGKTTFWSALNWLMDTTGRNKMDLRFISKMRAKELSEGEKDSVCVTMTYEIHNEERVLVKSFDFKKESDGQVTTSNARFSLFVTLPDGSREPRDGEDFNNDFKPEARLYSMFQGEEDLKILNSQKAVEYLIDTFSIVNRYKPFVNFMEKASGYANIAAENALNSDRRQAKKASALLGDIKRVERELDDLRRQFKDAESNYDIYSHKIENQEKDQEASELVKKSNQSIALKTEQREACRKRIKDWYTFRLLDDMWVLRGFEGVAREFSEKVAKLSKERRRQEKAYDQASAVKKLFDADAPKDFVPLAVHVPDEKTMREMLEEEVCKVCGRPAPKGSAPYEYMQQRLQNFLDSLKPKETEEEDTLFPNEYIVELSKRETSLNDNLMKITQLPQKIDEEIAFDEYMRKKVSEYDRAIEKEEDLKRRIIAQAGSTEDELNNIYNNLNAWWQQKNAADRNRTALKPQIAKKEAELADLQEKLKKLSKDSIAEKVVLASQAFKKMRDAFANATERAKAAFISKLQKETNYFLVKLNPHDFMGSVKVIATTDGKLAVKLVDKDGSVITDPNTALETTMYMALLFAISSLTEQKHGNEIPLVFDAPTSSFTTAKETAFFKLIPKLGKQVIIVTKSFLNETADGQSILDQNRVSDIEGRIYRIEKMRPFNDKDLSTIRTNIITIK